MRALQITALIILLSACNKQKPDIISEPVPQVFYSLPENFSFHDSLRLAWYKYKIPPDEEVMSSHGYIYPVSITALAHNRLHLQVQLEQLSVDDTLTVDSLIQYKPNKGYPNHPDKDVLYAYTKDDNGEARLRMSFEQDNELILEFNYLINSLHTDEYINISQRVLNGSD